MNYELFKQLKDTGFPKMKYVSEEALKMGQVPSLSELIKECRGDFELVVRVINPDEKMYAASLNLDVVDGWHDSPEDAIARLWLKLNTK